MAKKKKPEAIKNSYLNKVQIEQESGEEILRPEYSEDEIKYIGQLQGRLERARDERNQQRPEFGGLDYISYFHACEDEANTVLKAAKNKADVRFQSGTLRTKLLALLSSFLGYNFKADIDAYDDKDVLVNRLGNAMEDVIDKTEELELDDEKKILRWYNLLVHGTTYVEEQWVERWIAKKTMQAKGEIGSLQAKWTTIMEQLFARPERKVLSNINVYLGNMNEYFIENQPYIFTAEELDYTRAKQIFGVWDRWKYVSRKKRMFNGSMQENNWRLTPQQDNEKVEKLVYQDPVNNEIQIVLNGVPMLPMGFPLTEVRGDGEYTLVQQNLEPMRVDFALGKSFVFKNKNLVAVLDEMMKLAVLKTQKSFVPPQWNTTSKLITKDVLMPAKITQGKPNSLVPVSEQDAQGVTNSEFGMIQEMIQFVDRNTVSQTFTGGKEQGGQVTATQITELQRQARIMMGLSTLAISLLEKKLALKRLSLLLEKWFEPTDTVVDEARQMIKNKYRITSRKGQIEGEGVGIRMVVPTEEMPTSEQARMAEEKLGERMNMPVRMIFLNLNELQKTKLVWVATVNPRPKRSGEMARLLIGQEFGGAMELGLQVNPEFMEERYAEVWDEDPSKMFLKEQTQGQQGAPQGQQQPQGARVSANVSASTREFGDGSDEIA